MVYAVCSLYSITYTIVWYVICMIYTGNQHIYTWSYDKYILYYTTTHRSILYAICYHILIPLLSITQVIYALIIVINYVVVPNT
jgi:hypothetical protein